MDEELKSKKGTHMIGIAVLTAVVHGAIVEEHVPRVAAVVAVLRTRPVEVVVTEGISTEFPDFSIQHAHSTCTSTIALSPTHIL